MEIVPLSDQYGLLVTDPCIAGGCWAN